MMSDMQLSHPCQCSLRLINRQFIPPSTNFTPTGPSSSTATPINGPHEPPNPPPHSSRACSYVIASVALIPQLITLILSPHIPTIRIPKPPEPLKTPAVHYSHISVPPRFSSTTAPCCSAACPTQRLSVHHAPELPQSYTAH